MSPDTKAIGALSPGALWRPRTSAPNGFQGAGSALNGHEQRRAADNKLPSHLARLKSVCSGPSTLLSSGSSQTAPSDVGRLEDAAACETLRCAELANWFFGRQRVDCGKVQ